MRNFVVVSSGSAMGPRACSFFCVETPDLGAESEFFTVGKAGAGVDHDGR